MKKILMTAAIAFAGLAAFAQLPGTREHNQNFTLVLNDQFTMAESLPAPLGYTITTGDYNNTTGLDMGSATYTVNSNLPFNVTTSCTSIAFATNSSFNSAL